MANLFADAYHRSADLAIKAALHHVSLNKQLKWWHNVKIETGPIELTNDKCKRHDCVWVNKRQATQTLDVIVNNCIEDNQFKFAESLYCSLRQRTSSFRAFHWNLESRILLQIESCANIFSFPRDDIKIFDWMSLWRASWTIAAAAITVKFIAVLKISSC